MPRKHKSQNGFPAPASGPAMERVYAEVKTLLDQARDHAWSAVNVVMVQAYWNIGRVIVAEEQQGKARADYGHRLVEELSIRLSRDYGRGFDPSNVWNMRAFYLAYPILDALRRELSWTHYRLLLRVSKLDARSFYETECVNAHWSTRKLERQINSLLFERLALEDKPASFQKFLSELEQLRNQLGGRYLDAVKKRLNYSASEIIIAVENR